MKTCVMDYMLDIRWFILFSYFFEKDLYKKKKEEEEEIWETMNLLFKKN